MLKRKFANRSDWKRILDKTYRCIFIEEENFKGYVAYFAMNKVREELWVAYGKNQICIVDDGYVWLQYFPSEGNTVLSASFDQQGQLVQCYFDIVKSIGVTAEGIPYCDDLFLDVVALPNGEIFVLDEDELDEAYEANVITKDEHELAHSVAAELAASLEERKNYLMNSASNYFQFLKQMDLSR